MSTLYFKCRDLAKSQEFSSTNFIIMNIMNKSAWRCLKVEITLSSNQIYMILIAVISILLITIKVFFPEFVPKLSMLFKKRDSKHDDDLDELLDDIGYSYDYIQDIFYSDINAWQRGMGYTRLYDEAAAPMSMIIDCEPIYFEYDNRSWMIELWKGQYGMTTGCEIGVYETSKYRIDDDYIKDTFYNCAGDKDMLKMSFVLKKNGKIIMSRKGVHWWLTGFKLGEFSHPHELTMELSISLKDSLMRDKFIKGLKEAGYNDEEIVVVNNTVRLVFDKPKTPQPYSRNKVLDYIMQANNKNLCEDFNELTKDYDNSIDKIIYVRETAPEFLTQLYKFGKSRSLFQYYL